MLRCKRWSGRRSVTLFGAILLTLFVSWMAGCQSSSGGEDGRVVSKSSYTRPPWVGMGLHLSENRRMGLSSHVRKRVKILELGIKQAQLEATTQATKTFDEDFAGFVVDFVGSNKVNEDRLPEGVKAPKPPSQDDTAWWKGLGDASKVTSQSFPSPILEAEGVYWEQVERIEPGPGGGQDVVRDYVINVLVSFEASTLLVRLSALLEQLRASPRYAAAVAILETNLESLEPPTAESPVDRTEVESIQTEMDSTGAEIDSNLDVQGPRGRKIVPPGDAD